MNPIPNLAEPQSGRRDALPRGTVLDSYTLVRPIADSSFGIVYFAREADSERRFAIKEYLPLSLAMRSDDGIGVTLRSPTHADAFERGLLAFTAEAQLLARRTHPALLRVLRCWQANGTVYRVMPYHEGDSLSSLRRAMTEPPDEAALRRLLFGLLGALQALHDANQVHGDVSPDNIIVLSDDRPVLLDTGAVRRALVGDQTRALMAQFGSGFAPLADDNNVSPATKAAGSAADLYALAAVAHFCITGVLPTSSGKFESLAAMQRAPRSRAARPPYSAGLLEVIDAALSPSPEQRPQNVSQFRAALAGNPEATPKPPEPPEPPEPRIVPAVSSVLPARPELDIGPPATPWVEPSRVRRRKSAHLAWWTAAPFVLLALAAGSWVFVQQRLAAPAQNSATAAPLPRAVEQLEPPAALPAPLPSVARRMEQSAAGSGDPAEASAASAAVPTPAADKVMNAGSKPPAVTNKPAAAPRQPPTRVVGSPRELCAGRTEFALYRCMQNECQDAQWIKHAQCKRLRETDSVD